MAHPRLKLDSEAEEACYHCVSRTAGAAWLFKEREKEVLRKQMWKLAEYCGLEIITYALMSNHYHVLVRVPKRRDISDQELLRLYLVLYSELKPHQQRALDAVKADMARDGDLARSWRKRQLAQMFDVSQFNKLLKMRFSIWYNRTNKRVGTLWSERFRSVLVEDGDALKNMAAYIDLNCVRAGMVSDPKEYRFCGYAEAVAGNDKARRGLESIYGREWMQSSQSYRCLLFGTVSEHMEQKGRLDPVLFEEVVKTEGRLPLSSVLRSKIRYFVDGVALGSQEYVLQKAMGHAGWSERKPSPLAAVTDWGALHVLSPMRSRLWG
jgi:putative transposase